MAKRVRYLSIFIFCVLALNHVHAQNYNPYYNPLSLVKRLSFENFRNIKLLQTSIWNFGGGKDVIDKLVDQYADASALYFQNKIEEAANKFVENQKSILLTAIQVTKAYKEATEKMMNEGTKFNMRMSLKSDMNRKKRHEAPDKYLENARFALKTANDFFDRYQYATTANAIELSKAIYYYRRVKENLILMYQYTNVDQITDIEEEKKQLQNDINKLLDAHKKDMEDNKNRVYSSKEKKN